MPEDWNPVAGGDLVYLYQTETDETSEYYTKVYTANWNGWYKKIGIEPPEPKKQEENKQQISPQQSPEPSQAQV